LGSAAVVLRWVNGAAKGGMQGAAASMGGAGRGLERGSWRTHPRVRIRSLSREP
jgi:hypothetical protein